MAQSLQNSPAAMQMQGKNDLGIAICATIGAFSPALLLSTVGWDGTNAICMALCIGLLIATVGLLQNKACLQTSMEGSRK